MPEQITRWLTNDGYEYDTEKQAILHEQFQKEIDSVAKVLVHSDNIYSEDAAREIAELILEHFTVEKK